MTGLAPRVRGSNPSQRPNEGRRNTKPAEAYLGKAGAQQSVRIPGGAGGGERGGGGTSRLGNDKKWESICVLDCFELYL